MQAWTLRVQPDFAIKFVRDPSNFNPVRNPIFKKNRISLKFGTFQITQKP
jgi:hypothetical protein